MRSSGPLPRTGSRSRCGVPSSWKSNRKNRDGQEVDRHGPFERSEEVLREHAHGHQEGDPGARGRDPGRAGQGQGPPGRAAERAEGRAPDVRRRVPAPRRPQRARRGRIAGLIPGPPVAMRPRPIAAGLLLAVGILACRERGPAPLSAAGPRRVVTLAPNLTEIVFALGAGDRLVGVSEYSDYPEAARSIPRVGGLEVDPEKVAALRPDLVLAVAEGNAQGSVRSLQAAGVPVTVTPSGSLDSVLESVRIVGERLGRPEEGRRLADELARRQLG